MFKLLKRDLFQELLCLKFLIKLMRYYGRADLKICELGGEGISYAELYTVTPEIDPDYYFNPKTNTLEYGKDQGQSGWFIQSGSGGPCGQCGGGCG